MIEQHFETHEPIDVYVENGKGLVQIRAIETTESHVSVSGQDADAVEIDFRDGRLSVVAPKQRGSWLSGEHRLDMTITVPTSSSLDARLGSADLHGEGELSTLQVKSGSGDIKLETVSDSGHLQTGSGDIEIATAGDLQIKSGSGDLSLGECRAEIQVSTGSGDVKIASTHGAGVVKTGSGDLTVGASHADLSLSTGSGDLVVESAARGRVTMKGASGDVRVGVPAGTPVWTDITTVSGRIRSAIQGGGQPEPGTDHVELRARTVSGDITLVEA